VLDQKGDASGAEAAYRAAIKCDPKSTIAHSNLGSLLNKKGDASGAEAAYRAAMKCDPQLLSHDTVPLCGAPW
jgi:Flp pilus assembly protein TadD